MKLFIDEAAKGNLEFVKHFTQHLSLIAETDEEGCTALHRACENEQESVVVLLAPLLARVTNILQPTGINIKNNKDQTALVAAIDHGYLKIASYLIKIHGIDLDSPCYDKSPIDLVIEKGYLELALELVNKGADIESSHILYRNFAGVLHSNGYVKADSDGNSALSEVCHEVGLYHLANQLISKGAEVNVAYERDAGNTLLHYVCSHDNDRNKIFQKQKREMALLLLKQGADVNATNKYGFTPLHNASEAGYSMVARVLIEQGAKINVQDRKGLTPLHLACVIASQKVIRVLLCYNAETEIFDKLNLTALDRLVHSNFMISPVKWFREAVESSPKNRALFEQRKIEVIEHQSLTPKVSALALAQKKILIRLDVVEDMINGHKDSQVVRILELEKDAARRDSEIVQLKSKLESLEKLLLDEIESKTALGTKSTDKRKSRASYSEQDDFVFVVSGMIEEAKTSSDQDEYQKLDALQLDLKLVESDTPDIKLVESDTPDLKLVESDTPDLKLVESDTPDLKLVESDAPDLKLVESDAPDLKLVESDAPDLKLVESDAPDLKPVESNAPDLKLVESNAPDLKLGESDTPDPKGVESNLPDPKGVESNLPDPKGVESNLPDPKGVESNLPDPKGVESNLPDPKGVESNLPDPKGVESNLPDPKGVESNLPDPKGVESNTPDLKLVESNAPDLKLVESNAPDLKLVESHAPDLKLVESHAPDLKLVESHAPDLKLVESHAPDLKLVESNAPDLKLVESNAPDLKLVESNAPDLKLVESNTPDLKLVESNTPDLKLVESNTPDLKLVESNTPDLKLVESNTPDPKGVESNLPDPKGVDSNLPDPNGVESNLTDPKGVESETLILTRDESETLVSKEGQLEITAKSQTMEPKVKELATHQLKPQNFDPETLRHEIEQASLSDTIQIIVPMDGKLDPIEIVEYLSIRWFLVSLPQNTMVTTHRDMNNQLIIDAKFERLDTARDWICFYLVNKSNMKRLFFPFERHYLEWCKLVIRPKLTDYTLSLYQTVQKFALHHGYQYSWQQGGCVYLRKDNAANVIRIRNQADLLNYVS